MNGTTLYPPNRSFLFCSYLDDCIHLFFYFVDGLNLIIMGEIHNATMVFDIQWLLFLPSIYNFTANDAYVNTVEYNKLYIREQRNYLKQVYQHSEF